MKKSIKHAVLALFMLVTLISVIIPARADYGNWTDDKDDIRCFTKAQIQAFGIIIEEAAPENADQLIEQINNYWTVGTLSATPDCIDMLKVTITELGDMATLSITMEGNIKDCDIVAIYLYGNCTGTPWGLRIIYSSGGLGGGETSQYDYVDEEGTTHSGTPEIDGSEISVEYPNVENCNINILAMTYNTHSEILCCDKFPDPSSFTPGGGDGSGSGSVPIPYVGWDPITGFFDTIAGFMFGWLCGRLPYLLLMAIFLTVTKVLMDRKNIVALIFGMILSIISFWSLFWYLIDINFLAVDPLFTVSLMSILDLIICGLYLLFVLLTYGNRFGDLDDNEWTFYMAFAMIFIESLLFLSPFYFYYCYGQPTLSLIIEFVFLAIFIMTFYLTEKFSKGRLK